MSSKLPNLSARGIILLVIASLNLFVLAAAVLLNSGWFWVFPVTAALMVLAIVNVRQKKHTVLANFPVLGYVRFMLEGIRPELRQYFWESDLDGRPFNRRQRSIVYQRAKNVRQTVPFGMVEDPETVGHEWVAHSTFPARPKTNDLRVTVGSSACTQPYSASILNIGAMSYGALSKTAIRSLNEGAALGKFAHNTGEGGISEHHLQGGDLIWQIGTGYFGCRDLEGNFFPELFKANAGKPEVKMIEIKLSQGAKPGHGGILPAEKNTQEIAAIRNVKPHTTNHSPSRHTAFSDPVELIQFVGFLRVLSDGKPIGFKMCIGDRQEFVEICNAIVNTGIVPDFITIDGGEGGTGAAPLEFSDHVGMPLHEALAFVTQTLSKLNLKEEIKVFASGRLITAFDILKCISLGADAVYSARGMMFSLGCIQALKCDSGRCPVGIATQDPNLYKGLDITEKKVRVANFHGNTLKAMLELMEACGFEELSDIKPTKFFRKVSPVTTRSFQEIYFNDIDDRLLKSWQQSTMLN